MSIKRSSAPHVGHCVISPGSSNPVEHCSQSVWGPRKPNCLNLNRKDFVPRGKGQSGPRNLLSAATGV